MDLNLQLQSWGEIRMIEAERGKEGLEESKKWEIK